MTTSDPACIVSSVACWLLLLGGDRASTQYCAARLLRACPPYISHAACPPVRRATLHYTTRTVRVSSASVRARTPCEQRSMPPIYIYIHACRHAAHAGATYVRVHTHQSRLQNVRTCIDRSAKLALSFPNTHMVLGGTACSRPATGRLSVGRSIGSLYVDCNDDR
jgi:hypothetical protein